MRQENIYIGKKIKRNDLNALSARKSYEELPDEEFVVRAAKED
jgi:hypothetical protein